MIISLKRFKTGRRSSSYGYGGYSGGGGGAKLDTLVEFPINGLDLAPFVLSSSDGDPLIYDLFAISNHMGSANFGHYTAYGKHWKD
jgi:ubiquitin C-terminal hydrolase